MRLEIEILIKSPTIVPVTCTKRSFHIDILFIPWKLQFTLNMSNCPFMHGCDCSTLKPLNLSGCCKLREYRLLIEKDYARVTPYLWVNCCETSTWLIKTPPVSTAWWVNRSIILTSSLNTHCMGSLFRSRRPATLLPQYEERYVATLITAAKETTEHPVAKLNGRRQNSEDDDDDARRLYIYVMVWPGILISYDEKSLSKRVRAWIKWWWND